MKLWQSIAILTFLTASAVAADLAVLRNGYTIRHETREQIGDLTRLYISADKTSFVDIATAEVDRFERDDSPPPIPSPAPTLGVKASSLPPAFGLKSTPRASPQEIADAIGTASSRYRLDPDFVSSVVSAESGFNSHAVSPKGAQGLMQLMPGTASELGIDNAFDPVKNTDGGTRYLRMLLERFHFDVAKALAAYNAGAKRVDQHNGVPPYLETRKYVARIINDYNRKKLAQNKTGGHLNVAPQFKAPKARTPASTTGRTVPAAAKKRTQTTVYQAQTFPQQ